MTAGALEAIEEARLAVPDQIAIIGFDEISWAPLLRTALTTLSQPAYELGHESARLLLSRINGYSGSPRTVVLPTYLNIRASSTPKRGVAEARQLSFPTAAERAEPSPGPLGLEKVAHAAAWPEATGNAGSPGSARAAGLVLTAGRPFRLRISARKCS